MYSNPQPQVSSRHSLSIYLHFQKHNFLSLPGHTKFGCCLGTIYHGQEQVHHWFTVGPYNESIVIVPPLLQRYLLWVCRHACSSFPLNKLVYDGAMWIPMAVPCTCRYYTLLTVNMFMDEVSLMRWHMSAVGGFSDFLEPRGPSHTISS